MISKFLKTSFLVLASLVIVSCGSDDEGPAEAAQVKFSAQVGGAPFRTDAASGVLSNDGRFLTVTATNENSETITLRIGSFDEGAAIIANDTYLIDENNGASITYTTGGITFTSNVDAAGFITISNLDPTENTIFGSFASTLTSSDGGDINVESGSLFNIMFTEQ